MSNNFLYRYNSSNPEQRVAAVYIRLLAFTAAVMLLNNTAIAQKRSGGDSVTVLMEQETQQRVLETLLHTPAGLLANPFGTFSRADVSYGREKGELRLPQQAPAQSGIQLFTNGVTRVKKWLLYGSFQYTRNWYDSVAWSHRLQITDPFPYYFASQKPGNWDEEQYDLQGMGVYQLNDHWAIGSGLQYNVIDAARSNDPRPVYKKYRLHFMGDVSWKSAHNLRISVGGRYAYGYDRTAVSYSNDDDNNIPSAVAYRTYDFLGYGYYRYFGSSGKQIQSKNRTWQVNAQVSAPAWDGQWWSGATYQHSKDTVYRDLTASSRQAIGIFTLRTYKIATGWNKGTKWSILLEGIKENGEDFNRVLLDGFNYRYSHTAVQASASLSNYASFTKGHSYSAKVTFDNIQKQDGNTAHELYVANATLSVTARWHLPRPQGDGWLLEVSPGAYIDAGTSLAVPPTLINLFTKAVALPETQYYQTNRLSIAGKAGYIRKLTNKKYALLYISFQEATALNAYAASASSDYSFYPHGNRWSGNVHLSFNF